MLRPTTRADSSRAPHRLFVLNLSVQEFAMGATTDGTVPLPPEGFKRLRPTLEDADSYRRAAYEFLAVGEERPDWEPELEQALLYVLTHPAELSDVKARSIRRRWLDPLLRIGWMGYALVISEDWSGLDAEHGRALLAVADDELNRRMEAAAWPTDTKHPWHDQIGSRVKGISSETLGRDGALCVGVRRDHRHARPTRFLPARVLERRATLEHLTAKSAGARHTGGSWPSEQP